MNQHIKAFLLILLLGGGGIVAAKFLLPLLQEQLQRTTSDAAGVKGDIRIGVDNWIGYFPLCSQELRRRMRQAGYALHCEDDNADYRERFRKLKSGKLQLAVATVDSYLLNGAESGYPGTMVAVLDESKGGDAIVAHQDRIANLDALKGRSGLRIAYTPASPSEQLLKSVSEHFDLGLYANAKHDWQLKSDGSSAALERLLKGEADAAVVWEPDVSRALAQKGIHKLIGTEDTDKLIVDVLLVERRFSKEQEEAVTLLLREYFNTLRHFNDHPDELRREVVNTTRLKETQVEAMLRGVSWATLSDNALGWFSLATGGFQAEEGLVESINAALSILRANGDFQQNPLPDGDPYRIINSKFIAQLQQTTGSSQGNQKGPTVFSPLDEAGWKRLREVGTLKVEPVSFRRSSAMLDYDGKLILDQIADKLRRYPNFRIVVKGHTGLNGDPQANLDLSAERAAAVARYLIITYNLDNNRIRALGYGSSQPLPQRPDESDRAYSYRLPRVEISLVSEAY